MKMKHSQTIRLIPIISEYIEMIDITDAIDTQTKENMSVSLASFIEHGVTKFIAGQREHGGNITDRNLDQELRNEITDIMWYNYAKDWKQNKDQS